MTDWSKAPEWAKWTARDADGWSFFYSEEPKPGELAWKAISEDARCEANYNACPNWRDTLEMRPAPKSELPTHLPDWNCDDADNGSLAVWDGCEWFFCDPAYIVFFPGKITVRRP